MILDNEVKNNEDEDRKVHHWIASYTEEGKLDIVTGYFTVGALAWLSSHVNNKISKYRLVLGDIVFIYDDKLTDYKTPSNKPLRRRLAGHLLYPLPMYHAIELSDGFIVIVGTRVIAHIKSLGGQRRRVIHGFLYIILREDIARLGLDCNLHRAPASQPCLHLAIWAFRTRYA